MKKQKFCQLPFLFRFYSSDGAAGKVFGSSVALDGDSFF